MATKSKSIRPAVPQNAPDPELPDEFIRGILYEWGRATLQAHRELSEGYPGWAAVLAKMYGLVDDVLGSS